MQSRETLERLARFFSLLLFLSFLSRLGADAASSSRDSLCRAHVGAVVEKSPRLDKRFKISVQRDALLDSTGLQSTMFLTDRSFSQSSSRFFRAHLPCSSLAKYRQRLITLRYRELIKSFSVSSISGRTVFVYH